MVKIGDIIGKLGMHPEVPKLLLGPAGIGKTQCVYQFAEKIGRKVYTWVLSHLDIDDLKGIPYVSNGQLSIKRGPLIPEPQEKAIIFLDEITTANRQMRAIALKILDEKVVGYHRLDNCYIIAAGNPVEWNGLQLDRLISSRCIIWEVEADIDDWIMWSMKYVNSGSRILGKVQAFLKTMPQFLLDKPKVEGMPYPCPRQWEKVILMDSEDIEDIKGCVGEIAATQFNMFCKIYDNFEHIEQVLDPQKPIPDIKGLSIDKIYISAVSLGYRTRQEDGDVVVERVLKYLNGYEDIKIAYLRIILKRGIQLQNSVLKDIKLSKVLL